jgi:hypothetical protein
MAMGTQLGFKQHLTVPEHYGFESIISDIFTGSHLHPLHLYGC